jgi:hypothetical protein
MKNLTRHTGALEIVERLPSSENGNPRYAIRVDGCSCVTAPDSMVAYDIRNCEGRQVIATIGTHYGRATLNTLRRL